MGSDYYFSNYWVNKGGAMSDIKCPFCNKPLQPTHRSENEYWCGNTDCTETSWKFGSISLWQELIYTKKQVEIYHEFVTKLYLNGDITDESLIRLQKRLYIQTKGGDNE